MPDADETHREFWAQSQALHAARDKERALHDGGGGGTSDGMEARVAKLEAHMEHVRDELAKLSGVPAQLATITERVSHLPTKDELGNKLKGYLAVGVGLVAIVNAAIAWGPKLLGH